jgi:L-rhamnose-H+ transport protein
MTSNTVQAVLLVLCAAIMNAAYALPMKLNKKWEWEHSWFAFSILGVGVVPTIIALLTVPKLWSTYSLVSGGTLAAMVLFGASWGVSLVFFGLALTRLGLAITFAVCLGTSAAVGALTPLIAQHSDLIMTRQGGLIILGVVMIILGVALCGLAGKHREAALQQASATIRHGFWWGYLLAFVSGILGSMLNLGLAYGGSIQRAAQQHGASLAMMSNAVWLPCLYAGFLPGAIYCYILMRKKNNVTQLRLPGTWYYWFAAASMGFLWYGSIILYSISTVKLGALGPSIGWPLFLASIVVASTVFGALTGEWARTGTRPIRTMIVGVSFLVLAIAILSYAGRA